MTNYDPLDLKAQERGKSDKDMQARLLRETEEADIRWLMNSKRGRRIVWRLLDYAGVFRSSFAHSAMQMAFSEGYKNYGLRVLTMVHAQCPELYPQMMKEATNDGTDNGD